MVKEIRSRVSKAMSYFGRDKDAIVLAKLCEGGIIVEGLYGFLNVSALAGILIFAVCCMIAVECASHSKPSKFWEIAAIFGIVIACMSAVSLGAMAMCYQSQYAYASEQVVSPADGVGQL